MRRLYHQTARAIRRAFGLDRERRWNREHARGDWTWLRSLDELAHHAVIAGYVQRLAPNGRILDVGSGDGVLLDMLQPLPFQEYVGLDFAAAVDRTKHLTDQRTRFIVGDMNDFAADSVFDAIVFNESLYYMWDVGEGLARYAQALAPRGVFVVSMHDTPANAARWATIEQQYQILDAVSVTHRRGTRWEIRVFGPSRSATG